MLSFVGGLIVGVVIGVVLMLVVFLVYLDYQSKLPSCHEQPKGD